MITVEFFGVPRLRAGTRQVRLAASTVASALGELREACPALDGSIIQGGLVHPAYRLCINGGAFVTDPETALSDGDVLMLLSADVGG